MTEKIFAISILFSIFIFNVCVADAPMNNDKKIRILYEQALALYEKIERENSYIVQVNGINMAYLDFGPKDGVPLLWAHGSGSTGYELLNVKDGLINVGYRVIAIDYRGHGKTQISDLNASLYDVADDMARLMDHLHIRTAVVGGLSKGGFVAAAFYDEYPERTLGLLLEDGGSWSPQRLRDEKPFAGRLLKEIIKEAKEPEKIYSTRIRIFQTYYRAWAETDAQIDPTQVYSAVNVLASFRARPDGKWVSHVNRDLMIKKDVTAASFKMPSSQPLFQWSNQAMIPEIIFRNLHIPVYIIDPVSKHDMFPVGHQNRKLKSQHPSLIVHEVYEDTGHLAHFQRPERFVKTATALIDRVKKVSREAL